MSVYDEAVAGAGGGAEWGGLLAFPDYLFAGCQSGPERARDMVAARRRRQRFVLWDAPRRRIELENSMVKHEDKDNVEALEQIVFGQRDTFLYFDLVSHTLTDEPLGTGDGATTAFPIYKRRTYEGREHLQRITCPNHNYPQQFLPDGNVWRETELLVVKIDGTPTTAWTVSRATADVPGMITFAVAPDADAVLTVSGSYWTLVRLVNKSIPLQPLSLGWFQVSGSVPLVEPQGQRLPL